MGESIKILALFGKSGAGKDTIQNIMIKNNPDKYHRIISCTTRPQRDNETEGFDYYFISEEEFTRDIYAEKFIEALCFNGWFYGARIDQLNSSKINIGIFTPSGIEALFSTAAAYNLEILPVYINCPEVTRIMRALTREEHPNLSEIFRRYGTDEEDFANIPFSYLTFYNGNDNIYEEDVVETINDYCEDFFD